MNEESRIAVLIPSLSPDEKLTAAVREIRQAGFERIVIVNDGSTAEYDTYFCDAEALGATVIRHAVNLGKGRALKTGFNYILNEWKDCEGVITADSDGQHKAGDLLKCREALLKNKDALILGCRNFKKENIPFRSRFGNVITAKVMKLLVGVSISDTQTGLRAFSAEQMKKYLTVNGERFEYEMNMLLYSKAENIAMKEVP
ncbi:MAG: glycosyltransferase family 2 protein, partial [Lachnospiraceae bacterium]